MDMCPAFAEFHLPDGFNDKRVVRTLDSLACPNDVLVRSTVFKEEGNSLFRERKFKLAFSKYDLASKLLCFSLPSTQEAYAIFRSLAFALNLNLAACALKLQDFDKVIRLCSFVLKYDTFHTKCLFRRALAFKGLGDLNSAKLDLCKAVYHDSKNMEVLNELQEVERLLGCTSSINHKVSSSKTTPSVEATSLDKQEVCDMEVIPEVLQGGDDMECDVDCPVAGVSSIVSDDQVSKGLENESLPGSIQRDYDLQQHRFQSRGCFGSSLQITSSNLQRLMHGDVLSFFHSRSMSVVKVRVVPSKTQILTEVPLGEKSREAESSIPLVPPFCGLKHQAVPSQKVLRASFRSSTVDVAANWVSEELVKVPIVQVSPPTEAASQGFVGSLQNSRLGFSSRVNRQRTSYSRLRASGKMCQVRVFAGYRMDRVGTKRHRTSSLDLESNNFARQKHARIGPSWGFVTYSSRSVCGSVS